MAETLGDAVLILRTDDRGLDAGVDKAEAKSRGLGRTLDATSGSAMKMGGALVEAGNKAGSAANVIVAASNKVMVATGAQKAGQQQLFLQFNDMATMYSLGARPMQIFSSQIGQVTQAVQLMMSSGSKWAGFISSPWTQAALIGGMVLVPLISKLFETEDATDKASKANETWADKLDITKHSLAEVTAAMREYSAEAKKANEITLQSVALEVRNANAALQSALALRQKLAAQLSADEASAKGNVGQGTGGLAGAHAEGQLERTQARIAANDKAIITLEKGYQDAVGNVADLLAKMDTDPTTKIKAGFDGLRQRARDTIKDVEKLRARLGELNTAEAAELKKAQAAAKPAPPASGSDQASIGDMTALIQQLFPGARITSTTGGKHVAGSDHYAGRAIDFVPGGGMGQYSTAEVEAMLKAAGVTIRRNATGTEQMFGPGRSAGKPGDHDDHFHVAWTGSASPEEAKRKAEQAANAALRKKEEDEGRQESYNRDLSGLMQDAVQLRRQMAVTIEDRYKIEREQLDIATAEQARRITANKDYDDAEKAKLLAQLEIKAGLERELLDRRRAEETAKQNLEVAQAFAANERDLLQQQAQLAETREKRRDIEQRILDLTYDQQRAELEAVVASTTATDTQKKIAQARLDILGQLKAGDQQAHDREFASPGQRYLREVKGLDTSLNDQMENVAVHGLQTLEDKLVDVIMHAKSLGAAFKDVANQIIADLLRIGLERAVIAPLADMLFGGATGATGAGSGGGGIGGLFGSVLGAFGLGGGKSDGGDMVLGGALTKFLGGGANIASGESGGVLDSEWEKKYGLGGGPFSGVSGGLGGLLGGIFGGFHALGGLIPSGTFGIVGEHGPEPVISTASGTMVRPNSALAEMRGGGGPGKMEISISGARGNSEIMAMVRAGVSQGLSAYDAVVGERVKDHLSRRG